MPCWIGRHFRRGAALDYSFGGKPECRSRGRRILREAETFAEPGKLRQREND